MKILVITQDFPPSTGGIQSMVLELCRRFLAEGHALTVLCPGSGRDPSPLPPQARVMRVRVHSSWLFLPLLLRLPGLLRRGSYDAILYAQWQAGLGALSVPRKRLPPGLCLVLGRMARLSHPQAAEVAHRCA